MIDTTTCKDLAQKIEWIGFRNLTWSERRRVELNLVEVSGHLPRLLALSVWNFFGRVAPDDMKTRSASESLERHAEREEAKREIRALLEDYFEEESSR